MRALFIALTVLSALITEGDCLVCETCQAQGSVSCTGTLKTCTKGVTYCVKGFENNTIIGMYTTLTAFKKCVDPVKEPACKRNIIIRSAFTSLRITRLCCSTDGCNKGDMYVPIINETPNGLRCPTCYNDKSADGCTGFDHVMCNGNEGFCGSLTATQTLQGIQHWSYDPACMDPKKVGRCKAAIPRWYYDTASDSCLPFTFGGCQANNNNFPSKEECDIHCGGGRDHPFKAYSIQGCFNKNACKAGILGMEASGDYYFMLACT